MHRESPGPNREESHPPRSSWKRGRSSLRRPSSRIWSSTCLPATCRSLRGEVRRRSAEVGSSSQMPESFDYIFNSLKFSISCGLWGLQRKMLRSWGLGCGVSLEGECKAIQHSNELIPESWYHQPKPPHFNRISQDWAIIAFCSKTPHSECLSLNTQVGPLLWKMPPCHINVVFHWDCNRILLQFTPCITAKSLC